MSEASWRSDVDSLTFRPADHAGLCFIHRRAFVTLCAATTSEDCLHYYDSNRAAIWHAASVKRQSSQLDRQANFHLNSRDIARALHVQEKGSA